MGKGKKYCETCVLPLVFRAKVFSLKQTKINHMRKHDEREKGIEVSK